jgi:CspA family cold shock protein
MSEGHIKWYSEKKGFGFITSEEAGDLFVHRSNIKEFGHFGFQEGDPVTFKIKDTPKGQQAFDVRPLKSI